MGRLRVLFDPIDVPVHPRLQEWLALIRYIPAAVKEPILGVDKRFRLAHRWRVEISEYITQMLLRGRSADRTDGCPDNASRFALPTVLPIGTRSMIDGVLQNAWN